MNSRMRIGQFSASYPLSFPEPAFLLISAKRNAGSGDEIAPIVSVYFSAVSIIL